MHFRPYFPLMLHPVPNPFLLARLMAKGVTPAMLAKHQGIGRPEIDRVVEAPDFPQLVANAERLRDLGHAERLSRLCDLAFDLLEAALAAGDLRAGLFVLCERGAGRSAAQTLAEKVIAADAALVRALARAVERDFAPPVVPNPPPPATPGRRSHQNDLDRQCNRAEAILVRDLAATEIAAVPSAAEIRFGRIAAAIAKLKSSTAVLPTSATAPATAPASTARKLDPMQRPAAAPEGVLAALSVRPVTAPASIAGWPRAP